MTPKWEHFPEFILRSTGFPVEWIQQLRFEKTVQTFHQRYDIERAIEQGITQLKELEHADSISNAVLPFWKKARKTMSKRKPIHPELITSLETGGLDSNVLDELKRYQINVERLERVCEESNQVFKEELCLKQRQLQDIFKNVRLQEAVFQQSPSMYKNALLPYLQNSLEKRNADVKRTERQLISYMQRFCTKNETTSYFGPIQYGKLTNIDEDVTYTVSVSGQERERRTFFPYWAVSSLVNVLKVKEVFRPYCSVKLSYLLNKEGSTLYFPHSGKRITLQERYHPLIEGLSHDFQTILELTDHLPWTYEETEPMLSRLESKKWVDIEIPISITEPDALRSLREWLNNPVLPTHPEVTLWRQRINWLWDLKNSYASFPLEEKMNALTQLEQSFTEWTGENPRRSGGAIYADRTLLYEESHGPLDELQIGGTIEAVIRESVPKWLNLCAKHGQEKYEKQQKLAKEIFTALYPSAKEVPYLKFIQDVTQHPEAQIWENRWQNIQTDTEQHVQSFVQKSNDFVVELPNDSPYEFDSDLGWINSPDLMLAKKNDGTYQVILGEIHDTVMIWGWALQFHNDEENLTAQLEKKIKSSTMNQPMLNLLSNKRFKIVPFEYPGITAQMSSISNSPNQKIPLAQAKVQCLDNGVAISLPEDDGMYRIYNGELHTMVHSFFALPKAVPFVINTGSFTPRLMMGEVVVQRAKWQIKKGNFWDGVYKGSSSELFYAAFKFHLVNGLPKEAFVKTANQPKPFYIDFENYFLLEMWNAFWTDEECTLSEMLPGLNETWLTKGHEQHHTAELRISYFVERGNGHDSSD
nr:lantibiotic dehydratase [Paenibacillus xylanexedens]